MEKINIIRNMTSTKTKKTITIYKYNLIYESLFHLYFLSYRINEQL